MQFNRKVILARLSLISELWENFECFGRFSFSKARGSHPQILCKKDVFRSFSKFTGKHLFQSLLFNIKNETLTQLFSCEFCKISKNTFIYRKHPVASSTKHQTCIQNHVKHLRWRVLQKWLIAFNHGKRPILDI